MNDIVIVSLCAAHYLSDSRTFWGAAHTAKNITTLNIGGFEAMMFSNHNIT